MADYGLHGSRKVLKLPGWLEVLAIEVSDDLHDVVHQPQPSVVINDEGNTMGLWNIRMKGAALSGHGEA